MLVPLMTILIIFFTAYTVLRENATQQTLHVRDGAVNRTLGGGSQRNYAKLGARCEGAVSVTPLLRALPSRLRSQEPAWKGGGRNFSSGLANNN